MNLLSKTKALLARVPAPVRKAAEHVALVTAATFVATAKPLLPQLLDEPSLAVGKAITVAAAAAALTAGAHAARAALKSLAAAWSKA
jgi:hypothetical protein